MQVTVNGRSESFGAELTVAELLSTRNLHPIRVAVEINEEIVPRATFDEAHVRDGDRIEIVTFVGGG